MDILQGLNEKQNEAVTTTEGYVRVVAGAGSGKTKALSHRYAFLVDALGVASSGILCVTFTNKAAGEMKSRIRKLIGDHDTGLICTFHGFCVKELREDIHLMYYPKNFQILDDEDQNDVLGNVYTDNRIDSRKYTLSMSRDMIAARKENLEYISYINKADNKELEEALKKARRPEDIIFFGYLLEQKRNYLLDYNDLINFTYHILISYKEVRDYWQRKIQYVMVDEFQDVSHKQYQIANILSEYHRNLFVVGDPDQTIYSWRGADVKIFLNFPNDHPDTKTIIMDNNYRSKEPIIRGADSMIEKNTQRVKKTLVPMKNGGNEIVYYHADDAKNEAKWIASTIKELCEKGAGYSDIAILYRAHHVSRAVEEMLLERKIPYVIYSGVEFYGRKEIKDIISYLKMILLQDDLSFTRAINIPKRNFGKKKLEFIKEYAKKNSVSLYEALKANLQEPLIQKSKADEFVELVEEYRKVYKNKSVSDLMQEILDRTGYEEELKLLGENERLENIAELKQALYELDKNEGERVDLEEYLQSIALFTNMDKEEKKKSVKLMTVHTSKGLEFPIVFVCGLSEGIFPSGRITEFDEMEEERRIAYVAFTRAEEMLFLSDAEGFTFDNLSRCPSRFVFNIDDRYIKYVVPIELQKKAMFEKRINGSEHILKEEKSPTIVEGTRIRHKYFGEGIVTGIDYEHKNYEILFDRFDTPRSIMMTVELEIV